MLRKRWGSQPAFQLHYTTKTGRPSAAKQAATHVERQFHQQDCLSHSAMPERTMNVPKALGLIFTKFHHSVTYLSRELRYFSRSRCAARRKSSSRLSVTEMDFSLQGHATRAGPQSLRPFEARTKLNPPTRRSQAELLRRVGSQIAVTEPPGAQCDSLTLGSDSNHPAREP